MKKLLFILAITFLLSCDKEDTQQTDCNCVYLKEFKHITTYPDGTVINTGWQTYGQTKPAECDSEELVFIDLLEYPNTGNSVTISEYRWKLKCN